MLVLDGALGTQLESAIPPGLPLQIKSHPLWSTKVLIEQPDLIRQVHQSYVDAGADIITTATYQASKPTLRKFGDYSSEQTEELWNTAIDLASVGSAVAALVGPYAGFLANGCEYTGDYGSTSLRQLWQYHALHLLWFASHPKVGVVAIETIPNLLELKALSVVLRQVYSNPRATKPFWLSLCMRLESQLADGTPIEEVCQVLNGMLRSPTIQRSIVAIGCNCVDFELVTGIVLNLRHHLDWHVPVVVYPNLGMQYDHDIADATTYGHLTNHRRWAALVREWVDLGVSIVGGCCSTGPEEIEIVRRAT